MISNSVAQAWYALSVFDVSSKFFLILFKIFSLKIIKGLIISSLIDETNSFNDLNWFNISDLNPFIPIWRDSFWEVHSKS